MWGLFSSFEYASEWEAVGKIERSNPKTAISKIDAIEKQAVKESNQPQQLRCIVKRGTLRQEIEDSAFVGCMAELTAFQSNTKDGVARSVATYLIGKLYMSYYKGDRWAIDQRTKLVDEVPENMDEWSTNIFMDQYRKCSVEALSNESLKKVASADYGPILSLGKDSRIFYPTLYDLILFDMFENANSMNLLGEKMDDRGDERLKYLNQWVTFHAKDQERDAYVKAKLTLLDYIHKGKKNQDDKIAQLERLLEEEKASGASVLVRAALCDAWKQGVDLEHLPKDSKLPQRIMDCCQEGIKAYPNYVKINLLKSLVDEMQTAFVQISIENEKPHTSDKISLKLHYANLSELKCSLYRLDVTPIAYFRERVRDAKKSKVADFSFPLKKSNYVIPEDTVVEIPALDFGIYRIVYNGDRSLEFEVSNLYYLRTTALSDPLCSNYIVVDAKSGAPKSGVKLTAWKIKNYYSYEEQPLSQTTTNEKGFAQIGLDARGKRSQINTYVEEGRDRFLTPDDYGTYQYERESNVSDNSGNYVAIFTDRSIYRPSQTVHYKVIYYHLQREGSAVLPNTNVKITLYDANSQVVSEQKLTTNEYGSVASSFVLPANGLSGNYSIAVRGSKYGSGQQYFSVEEYKRPTFEVKMSRPTGIFSFGDSIEVKGQANYLMGAPLSEAKVEYRVVRTPSPWWWSPRFNSREGKTLVEGETVMKEDGSFSIPFKAMKEEDDTDLAFYQYTAYAKVTDANGETHEQSIYLSVGDRSLFFSSSVGARELMSQFPSIKYQITNLNGEGQVVNVSYEILRDSVVVKSGEVMSDAKGDFIIQTETDGWRSGKYVVSLKAKDAKEREVRASYGVILYRETDTRPPVETILWTENMNSVQLAYGESHTIRVGSSLKDAHLLIIEESEQGEEDRRWVDLSDEIKTFTFSLEKKSGEEKRITLYLIRDGKLHQESSHITLKHESKALPLKLAVFRDKMMPGSKETWTLSLPKDREAELLAAMYDASLDQIRSHGWSFHPDYSRYVNFPYWSACQWSKGSLYYMFNSRNHPTGWWFDRFIDFPNGRKRVYIYGSRAAYSLSVEDVEVEEMAADEAMVFSKAATKNAVAPMAAMKMRKSMGNTMADSEESDMVTVDNDVSEVPSQVAEPQIRTNFSETAFFYPQLRSDKEGNVLLSFEMPESLTRWNFKALAHTKDLFYGQLSEQVVTQKDFMVSPNLPRFLRKGDRCVLSAKVINLSETRQKGSVEMLLMDPMTEKVMAKEQASFSVEAGKTGAVTCSFKVPREVDAVLVRTSAVADNFSDAEQSLVPILSDRMVVTQSLPLYVRGGATKEYTFRNLLENQSETLTHRFLKLEFATNPIWYAVQALPSVAAVEHENALSYSAAHFASLMSEHIARSNPKIFKVIELWKQQSGDKQTLLSNLEKNQDVKNLLLNESPWVLEAKSETEMKQRLSTLFDVNDLQGKSNTWFDKLMEFRLESGAYSWFKGMYPSQHTTLFVLDNFGRLRKSGIVDDVFLKKAGYAASLNYLDKELQRSFETMKRYDKDYKKHAHVGMYELYLFQVHSLFPEVKVAKEAQESFDFYYGLMKSQWKDLSLGGKAMAAIALYRGGDKSLAQTVIESRREFSTTTDEMGMFWQKNVSGYLWQDAAISTHTRIMEAFETVDPKREEQDEMRLWLLNQKRTQNWDNIIANVDALNALLLSGSDWLSTDNHVTIKMGDEVVTPENKEVGTGYFTQYVMGEKVKPSMGRVELKSEQGGNISWGALYWQFEEEIDKVWKNKTALHVEKMVMLAVREGGEEVLKKIDEKTSLKVGDKLVVRVTLRTDRDMDYVSLKDQRASCLEPTQQLSGYRCGQGTCFYQSPKDAAMYYFFDHLAKGTYVFEYPLWITHAGDFSNGITSAQCLYAPEFLSNTGSVRIKVQE